MMAPWCRRSIVSLLWMNHVLYYCLTVLYFTNLNNNIVHKINLFLHQRLQNEVDIVYFSFSSLPNTTSSSVKD